MAKYLGVLVIVVTPLLILLLQAHLLNRSDRREQEERDNCHGPMWNDRRNITDEGI